MSGFVTAGALVITTVLFLLDSLKVLGEPPEFRETSAGAVQDQADYWIAWFEHQNDILWNVIARDTVGPLGFVALTVLVLAVHRLLRSDRPDSELAVLFVALGGTLVSLADLLYLSGTIYWRETGWVADPATSMVAIGQSVNALGAITQWPETAGLLLIAAGLVCLGRLGRRHDEFASWLVVTIYVEAALLVGLALSRPIGTDTAYDIFALATGALVAPLVAIGVARAVTRTS